jgi:hypothetical protein
MCKWTVPGPWPQPPGPGRRPSIQRDIILAEGRFLATTGIPVFHPDLMGFYGGLMGSNGILWDFMVV